MLAQGPGLVIFDARYGPGETVDSRPTSDEDLHVSSKETNALNKVIAELHLEPHNRKQALHALAASSRTDNSATAPGQGSGRLTAQTKPR